MQQIYELEHLLYTAPRVCSVVLAATGTSGAAYYGLIIEGGERNTTSGCLLSQELRVCASNVPGHCQKRMSKLNKA